MAACAQPASLLSSPGKSLRSERNPIERLGIEHPVERRFEPSCVGSAQEARHPPPVDLDDRLDDRKLGDHDARLALDERGDASGLGLRPEKLEQAARVEI